MIPVVDPFNKPSRTGRNWNAAKKIQQQKRRRSKSLRAMLRERARADDDAELERSTQFWTQLQSADPKVVDYRSLVAPESHKWVTAKQGQSAIATLLGPTFEWALPFPSSYNAGVKGCHELPGRPGIWAPKWW